MIVKIYPEGEELTTALPLVVHIIDDAGNPRAKIVGVGELELSQHPLGGVKSDFHFTLPGQYQILIKDAREEQSIMLEIKEHRYLNFREEFGFFLCLFSLVMTGVYLWVRSVMKSKIAKT